MVAGQPDSQARLIGLRTRASFWQGVEAAGKRGMYDRGAQILKRFGSHLRHDVVAYLELFLSLHPAGGGGLSTAATFAWSANRTP